MFLGLVFTGTAYGQFYKEYYDSWVGSLFIPFDLIESVLNGARASLTLGRSAKVCSSSWMRDALVPSPLMTAMAQGQMARIEELTRIPADVQDTLITILRYEGAPE